MYEIPVGLEQKAFIKSWSLFFFLLLLKFVKLKTLCSFQVENGLVFGQFLCQTPQLPICWAIAVTDSKATLEADVSAPISTYNFLLYFCFFFLFKSWNWNSTSKYWNPSGNQLTFLHTSQKNVGRKRRQQKDSAGLNVSPWGIFSPEEMHCPNTTE